MALLKVIGSKGWNDNQLYQPKYLCVDQNGDYLVLSINHATHNIKKFTPSGDLVYLIKNIGQHSLIINRNNEIVNDSNYLFNDRSGIYERTEVVIRGMTGGASHFRAQHPNGTYITLTGNHINIVNHDATNTGKHCNIDNQNCTLVSAICDSDGNIIVTDDSNHQIHIIDSKCQYKKSLGSFGSQELQFDRPSDIAIDNDGNYVVADTNNRRLQVITPDGKFVKFVGERHLKSPSCVAINRDGDYVVTDFSEGSIKVFSSTIEERIEDPFVKLTQDMNNKIHESHSKYLVEFTNLKKSDASLSSRIIDFYNKYTEEEKNMDNRISDFEENFEDKILIIEDETKQLVKDCKERCLSNIKVAKMEINERSNLLESETHLLRIEQGRIEVICQNIQKHIKDTETLVNELHTINQLQIDEIVIEIANQKQHSIEFTWSIILTIFVAIIHFFI